MAFIFQYEKNLTNIIGCRIFFIFLEYFKEYLHLTKLLTIEPTKKKKCYNLEL